jgi:hypothetical protein
MRKFKARQSGVFVGAAVAFGLLSSSSAIAAAEPTLVPVAGAPTLMLGAYDLGALGYEAHEFFFSGTAQAYEAAGPVHPDGGWTARPTATAPYTTRMVVVRPKDPARFNGTVVVEWLNVSGGLDLPVDWAMVHRELVRKGYPYVAVSAQKVGIDGGASVTGGPSMALKKVNPARYGKLSHPGDAFAFDIFSQAGRIVREAGSNGLLGGLAPERLIAMGESQSAIYLTTYVPAIDPLARVYDGFLIHSRFGPGAALDGRSVIASSPGSLPQAVKMPVKPRVPVLTVVTETDVAGGPAQGFYAARQPDAAKRRTWEIAGAAHADNYTYQVGFIDSGSASIATLAAAYAPTRKVIGQSFDKPIDFGPQQHYVVEAAVAAMDRWLRTGEAPPTAAPLKVAAPPKARAGLKFAVDKLGNAEGGVRTPWMDTPTAHLAGVGNSGSSSAWMIGVGEPFDAVTLQRLYPGGKAEYLKRFETTLGSAIAAGFILPEDRQEILDLAAASFKGAP